MTWISFFEIIYFVQTKANPTIDKQSVKGHEKRDRLLVSFFFKFEFFNLGHFYCQRALRSLIFFFEIRKLRFFQKKQVVFLFC